MRECQFLHDLTQPLSTYSVYVQSLVYDTLIESDCVHCLLHAVCCLFKDTGLRSDMSHWQQPSQAHLPVFSHLDRTIQCAVPDSLRTASPLD